MAPQPFQFKRFRLEQFGAAHPAGTDGVLLGAWADIQNCRTILDIGTGTGLIALMLAQRAESQAIDQVVGIDIHQPSVFCAADNFKVSPWSKILDAVHSTVQNFELNTASKFDLIVSNPPFFNRGTPAYSTERTAARSVIHLTHGVLLEQVNRLMAPGGRFCTILPASEGRKLCESAACQGLYCTQQTEISTRPGKPIERLLLKFERNPSEYKRSRLMINDDEGKPSDDFRQLTRDFYTDF